MINKKHNFTRQLLNESVEINEIYVYIDDKDDSSKLQTELFRLGFLWCDKTSIVYHPYGNDHPYDIYNMILCINLKDKDISFLSDIGEFRDYIKNDTNYNINGIILYQFKDFDKIISIIKGKPTYDSKQKPSRILEKNIHRNYTYNTIPFRIETVDDLNIIELFLNKNEKIFDDLNIDINKLFTSITHEYLYKHINIVIEFMINVHGRFIFAWDMEQDYINYVNRISYEKIFTVNDLENGLIDKILKYGSSNPIPIYKSKQKPIRESKQLNIKILIKTKNNKESKIVLEKLFELGFTWPGGSVNIIEFDFSESDVLIYANLFNNHITYGESLTNSYLNKIYNGYFYDIYPKVFNFNELNSYLNIVKNKILPPDYKSKNKNIRILENTNYTEIKNIKNYKFVAIKTNTIDENINIQKKLFENGYDWQIGQVNKLMNTDISEIIILVEHETKKMYTIHQDNTFDTDQIRYNICPYLFKYSEFNIFINYLKFGVIKPIYEPKQKPIRESNTFKFESINIHARNIEENIQIQQKLFENGFLWADGSTDILFDGWDDIVFLVTIYKKIIFQSGNLISFIRNESYIKNNYKSDDNLYTIDDWDNKIKYLIKGINPTPTYKPKQKPIRE